MEDVAEATQDVAQEAASEITDAADNATTAIEDGFGDTSQDFDQALEQGREKAAQGAELLEDAAAYGIEKGRETAGTILKEAKDARLPKTPQVSSTTTPKSSP